MYSFPPQYNPNQNNFPSSNGPHCPGVPPPPPQPPTAQGFPDPNPPDRPGKFIVGVNKAKGVGFLQLPHPTQLVEMDFYQLMELRDHLAQVGWILYQTHMESLNCKPSAQFPLGRFGFPENFTPNLNQE